MGKRLISEKVGFIELIVQIRQQIHKDIFIYIITVKANHKMKMVHHMIKIIIVMEVHQKRY